MASPGECPGCLRATGAKRLVFARYRDHFYRGQRGVLVVSRGSAAHIRIFCLTWEGAGVVAQAARSEMLAHTDSERMEARNVITSVLLSGM